MTTAHTFRSFSMLVVIGLALCAQSPQAHAAGGSVRVANVYPTGTIDAGTQVSFNTIATGFTDPVYSFADSFSASGMTSGTIDKIGNFTWTPGIYDAGKHVLTVTVTDPYTHAASTTVSIVVGSNALIVQNILPGTTIAAGRTITFSLLAPGFSSPRYAVYDLYGGSSVSSTDVDTNGNFAWKPSVDELGVHQITIVATDIYGHTAQAIENITVIRPTVSISALQPGTSAGVGSNVSFVARGNMLTNPTFTVHDMFTGMSSITSSAIGASGIFTWIPTASDLGLHTIAVVATDAAGNSASSTVSIAITNAAPTYAPVAPKPTSVVPASGGTAGSTTSVAATGKTNVYRFTTYLGIGSHGTAVLALQKQLTALGYFTVDATGYFGPVTAKSVKAFQKAHGLEQVGFVGPGTRAALNSN